MIRFFITFSLFTLNATDTCSKDLKFIKSIPIGVTYSVCADSQYVYTTNNEGVFIISLQDLNKQMAAGMEIARYDLGVTFGVAIQNNLVFAASEQSIFILSISDPQYIKKLCEYHLGEIPHRLCIRENILFSTSDAGMDIFDVSNPQKLNHLSHYNHARLRAVCILQNTAYLASYNKGIEVVDITNPLIPQSIKYIDNTLGAWDVHINNTQLYVGRHGAGISIYNVEAPRSPKYLGGYNDDDNGEAQGVWGNGSFLYVADNYSIEVLDISNPVHPFKVAEYSDVSAAHDIFVNGELIFAATGNRSLLILKNE